MQQYRILGIVTFFLLSGQAEAATLNGEGLSLLWGVPFAGLLLSIALFPMLAERFWHRHYGKVALLWALGLVVPMVLVFGSSDALQVVWHAVLIEYLPFVMLLLTLFVVGGGILVVGGPWGTPAGNTLLLLIGTLVASIMGTTGAAMVLIHPLLRANAHRTRKVHLVVFFILLVANVGGGLSPLGDPPLYIGFLRGVPFFWPTLHMLAPVALTSVLLLTMFYVMDRRSAAASPPPEEHKPLRLRGYANVALLVAIIAIVLMQGVWSPGDTTLFGQAIGLERLLAMLLLGFVIMISIVVTPESIRKSNDFNWAPMTEVAKLFAAIFITIAPVLEILHVGERGALASAVALVTDGGGQPVAGAYFWMAGVLSAFLDNAPTYLVFFELASGDPVRMTGELAHILLAISAGSVLFGAMTYIGNAPNFMVRSIAAHRGVRMPGFFGYMLWSVCILLPVFALLTVVFFLR